MSDAAIAATSATATQNAAVTAPAAQVTAAPAANPYADWEPFIKQAQQGGYKAADLMRAFGETGQTKDKPEGQQPAFDENKFRTETLAQLRRENALSGHKDARGRHDKAFTSMVEKIKSSDLTDPMKALFTNAARGRLSELEMNSLYPADHPLHSDHLQPLNDEAFAQITKDLESWQTSAKAGILAQIGDAAAKGGKAAVTAAGNSAPSGQPTSKSDKPWESPDRDAVKAQFANMRAARNGASITAIAGA